jgi:peptide/nickel transport system substrate-binding protein
MHRHIFATLSIVISFLLLSFFTPAWCADLDTLRVGEMWEIDGLDPAKEGTFVKEKALIVETLVEADPSFALVPGLAESWEMTSDTKWEIRLRKGVVFHNGATLTATVAADSINRALKINPSLKSITHITKVAAAGDLVLHITTDGLFPPLPATLVYADLAIVHPDSKANDQGIIIHPIGTGPYALKEWRRAEQRVLLERHDAYWGEKAHIKKIEFRSIPDPATRSLEVQKGSVDFIPDAPYGDLDLLREKGLKVFIAQTARIYQINFGSLTETAFSDRRVRQALSYAINREEIVRYVLFGMGKPAAGAYEDTMSFANDTLRPHAYDPDKARTLLSEAGWRDTDKDGVLDKNGRALSLTLFTYPQRPGLKPMAMAISQQWNALGVKTQVRVMDWSAIGKEMKPGDARLAAFASAMIPDPDYFLRRVYAKDGSDNTWGYINPEVESLLAAGIGETDPGERLKRYKMAQAIVFDDQPLIHVSYYGVNIVTNPRAKGFVFNPVAHDYMLNTQMYLEN